MVRDQRTDEVHIPHEPVAIPGVTKNPARALFKLESKAGGEQSDLAPAGHLLTPLYVKSLPITKRGKTAELARIASQPSLGQEPEALLAALSLGALFVLILTSVVIKLFIN
jgi:hypothetical protein